MVAQDDTHQYGTPGMDLEGLCPLILSAFCTEKFFLVFAPAPHAFCVGEGVFRLQYYPTSHAVYEGFYIYYHASSHILREVSLSLYHANSLMFNVTRRREGCG